MELVSAGGGNLAEGLSGLREIISIKPRQPVVSCQAEMQTSVIRHLERTKKKYTY
jgi:hypothetical protein